MTIRFSPYLRLVLSWKGQMHTLTVKNMSMFRQLNISPKTWNFFSFYQSKGFNEIQFSNIFVPINLFGKINAM